jgi:imidazolonepropionase-like amidohydrolase
MEKEVLTGAIAAAKAAGMRGVVHVGSANDMLEAAQAGAALLMHVAWESALTDEQAGQLKTLDVPVVTTLYTMVSAPQLMDGLATSFEHEMVAASMLESFHREPDCKKLGILCDMLFGMELSRGISAQNFQRLVAAGVPYFVGTDSGVTGVFPGAALHSEMAYLVSLGRPPLEVLRAATSRPAAFLDPSGSFGRVAPGQRADLVLVRGDPSEDITATTAIEAVYVGGVALSRKQP